MVSTADKKIICVVGLGYVGLPLACLFSTKFPVIGFDINEEKINQLKKGIDETGEVEDLQQYHLEYTNNPKDIAKANFIIVAVPTPITEDNEPDLSLVESASKIVGQNLLKGSIIVYESTVYPGVTEEICLPILEKESGLKGGIDFKIGYSPERVNPGDKEHTIDKITKVVSGQDKEALRVIAEVYGAITKVHQAPNIKTAEAAKVIENIQRDLNIALMNELSLIFKKMDLNTREVIEAAGTKWNFHKYYPGLVGGHCISVDPYYLTHKAKQLGYDPEVILGGRKINNFMPQHVAETALDFLKNIKNPRILIMGLTFKENVPDIRNSKIKEVIGYFKRTIINLYGYDPLLKNGVIKEDFGIVPINNLDNEKFDLIIVFSPHKEFRKITLTDLNNHLTETKILMDLKEFYNAKEVRGLGMEYWSL